MNKTDWLDNFPLYALMLHIILFGFLFARPGSPFAVLTVSVFLFWIAGIWNFASVREKRIKQIESKIELMKIEDSGYEGCLISKLDSLMIKPFWAIM